MKIEILFRPPTRFWHKRLAEDLRSAGHDVRCVTGTRKGALPIGTTKAMALERRLFGPAQSLSQVVALPSTQRCEENADLVIALDGESSSADNVLEPLFDNVAGESALLAAVARAGTPRILVRAYSCGIEYDVVHALLAIEHQNTLSHAMDQALGRLISILLQAVRRFEKGDSCPDVSLSEPIARMLLGPRRFMARGLARKIAGRLPGGTRGPNHWRVGIRRIDGTSVSEGRSWPPQRFTILPDDGNRFYADPMPFEHEGHTYIFFEDFPYASGKGVIGMVEITSDGRTSSPKTVLEQPVHLSYPLVLRHRGQIYMLPEMSGAECIQLFRADPFPHRWVPDRVLVDNIVAADATPVCCGGKWWLFATLSDDGGSSWDQLGLFHAPDLLGPWHPHPDNPVLIDAGAARPAGAMWHENGRLMRVAQDCRGGYGVGLAFCQVDQLDLAGYRQRVVARLGPPDGYCADGVHTLNRSGDVEVIDLRFPTLGDPSPGRHPEALREAEHD